MRAYALTRLAKADIFDLWSYLAGDSEDSADRVEQAIYDACAFVAEAPNRSHSPRPYTPGASLLDPDSLSQLYDRVSAGDGSPPDCRRAAGKTNHTAHPETAPVTPDPGRQIVGLGRKDLRPEIGGFGTQALFLKIKTPVTGCSIFECRRDSRQAGIRYASELLKADLATNVTSIMLRL
jgi:plasmid stabilization system protein ParE